ncbi:single-strand DNA-binding protein [Lysinibacillus composti]|uniref:Single-stranded DNA-binding protein n=1 Tax=Lysinibacillus composti TaxID=720633 RepID=A0A3N9UIR5_9BACI|nr:single-stranded DNA-binding protein [Lysinibacillus composti]MBM7607551.1 single-strand DNA-binding protein [Lysinibacillus composti]RQW75943.1 single-stranded DNA-binding protein [Lysinibacillus composti]
MINRVVLVGRLTKDPELRYTPSGVPMTRFTLAVNRTFSNQQGEREADFISCLAWRKQAENLANYMKKGNLVGLEGRIQTGSFEQDGKRVYTTDIVCDSIQYLERNTSKSDNTHENYQPTQNSPGQPGGFTQTSGNPGQFNNSNVNSNNNFDPDDLPF